MNPEFLCDKNLYLVFNAVEEFSRETTADYQEIDNEDTDDFDHCPFFGYGSDD